MASQINALDDALARASNGDEAGFLELWRALQPRLLRFLQVVGCDDPASAPHGMYTNSEATRT